MKKETPPKVFHYGLYKVLMCRTPSEECLYKKDYMTHSCITLKKWLKVFLKI